MLKYIIMVTEDLMIAISLTTLLYALCGMFGGLSGRKAQRFGVLAGVVLSAAMAIVKNVTGWISTNQWNQSIFYWTILFSLLLIILSPFYKRSAEKSGGKPTGLMTVFHVLSALVIVLLLFYELPDVMAYPFNFETAGEGIISVAFLVRFLGWAGALILCTVFLRFLYKCVLQLNRPTLTLVCLDLGLAANLVRCLGQIFRPWITSPRWFRNMHVLLFPPYSEKAYPWAFPFTVFVHNNALFFILIVIGVSLLIPLVLFLNSIRNKGMWTNPAELRKIKATNRHSRRWAVIVLICSVIATVNLTAIKAYVNREVVLTSPEEYIISADRNVMIPLTQINDGHLHRFEYTTENGVAVRWIVVKKPNSVMYGVGLDACDVCGHAGYFERGTQIICKRCDVVMNINTIGFKGGCNPIPLESKIENEHLIIPLDKIISSEKEFR